MKNCQCSEVDKCMLSKGMKDNVKERRTAQMNKCGAHLVPGLRHPHCLLLRTMVSIAVGREE